MARPTIAHSSRNTRAVANLASRLGIQTSYRGYDGRIHRARRDALLAVAASLLSETSDDPSRLLSAIEAREQARLVEPVIVTWDGSPRSVAVAGAGARARAQVEMEDGRLAGTRTAGNSVELPALPPGYHKLHVLTAGREESALVISAPVRAYTQPNRGYAWGVFAPVYALRSARSWGCGDLSDLDALRSWVARLGGSAVATLPLLAQYHEGPLAEDSPYSPASRLAWNELYADCRAAPEFAAVRMLADSAPFREAAARLNAARLVDYPAAYALKRSALEPMSRALSASRQADLATFLAGRPEVEEYARFRARTERHGAWHSWPEAEPDYDPSAARYHAYAQWLMDAGLGERGEGEAAGLYLDLPLGVNAAGYDAWRWRDGFVWGVSAGAPPDGFYQGGQDWGFPPLSPQAARANGYEYFRAVLGHHMRHASWLRVDHVMGLHRLFMIPKGFPAADGVYVRYPADELYAVLCLESHRHRVAVVGENLGVVPVYVNRAMRRHSVLGTHVLPFEVDAGRAEPIRPPRPDEAAALNTHDLPTFAAWWTGADIDRRERLGELTPEAASGERSWRHAQVEAVSRRLQASGDLAWDAPPDSVHTLPSLLRYLARTDAAFLLVALEDLWGETEQQNVPGTWRERPNWRRKTALAMEEIEASPELAATLRGVDAARRVRQPPPASPA